MNITSYLFGQFSNGYTQYPDDYTKPIFRKFASLANAPTQIAIHRDNDLIYYAYIRRLDDGNKYIGICSVINGRMLTNFDGMFAMYEQLLSSFIANGQFVHFGSNGEVTSSIDNLHRISEEVDFLASTLRSRFDVLPTKPLPPVAYSESANSVKQFVITDSPQQIASASACYGYVVIHKSEGYESMQTNSYKSVLRRVSSERDDYKKRTSELSRQLTKARIQQRNMKWIAAMGFVIFVLGVVLWNKVLFPSEVTHYETGEFIYYGPLQDGKPHGVGVAIYPDDDKDGRKYYIGNFTAGERHDSAAFLFYQGGDYYYGSMNGDKWEEGTFYNNSDYSHFTGTFNNNEPYTGGWYEHLLRYRLKNGHRRKN